MHEGHFRTYSRRGENWYAIEDEKYRVANIEKVFSPYMLFYEHVPYEDSIADLTSVRDQEEQAQAICLDVDKNIQKILKQKPFGSTSEIKLEPEPEIFKSISDSMDDQNLEA